MELFFIILAIVLILGFAYLMFFGPTAKRLSRLEEEQRQFDKQKSAKKSIRKKQNREINNSEVKLKPETEIEVATILKIATLVIVLMIGFMAGLGAMYGSASRDGFWIGFQKILIIMLGAGSFIGLVITLVVGIGMIGKKTKVN